MTLSRAEERSRIRLDRRRKCKKVITAASLTVVLGTLFVWLWEWTGG